MRAAVRHRYGSPDVLELRDVEKPVVGDDEVLVRVRASSVNPLAVLRDLLDAGKIAPTIDRQYRLDEVPEALRYLGGGHARAKIAITV
jgi:NADPH:quinone reductase-like Zn-dependent oxidoreductase